MLDMVSASKSPFYTEWTRDSSKSYTINCLGILFESGINVWAVVFILSKVSRVQVLKRNLNK